MRFLRRLGIAVCCAGLLACTAAAAPGSWANPQIEAVTSVGVLGHSVASFAPQSPLTQGQLADAIQTTNALQHPAAPPAPPTVALSTSVAPGATVAGAVAVQLAVSGPPVDHVDFAVDGTGVATERTAPFVLDLETRTLADGVHALAAKVAFAGGGYAIATWQVTVANALGAAPAATGALVPLPLAKSWLPPAPSIPVVTRPLYRAASPPAAVTVKQLDGALVAYLGLGGAAREIQATLARAGLRPPPNTGTEAVARLLALRLNHPAREDSLELLPNEPVTRAEAAYSFAHVLQLDDAQTEWAQQTADAFALPELTQWQQRILATAVHYVGYPYVWGGTSPTAQTLFGVHSAGGFDCSGFVWRVYKLTPYAGEGTLASVLRGRTTYVMSGEVPRAQRLAAADLRPADVMFFGAKGPRSSPNVVDHTALYLGGGWFIQSSGEGVTLLPFDGWYAHTFAWGRRPLREAGLAAG